MLQSLWATAPAAVGLYDLAAYGRNSMESVKSELAAVYIMQFIESFAVTVLRAYRSAVIETYQADFKIKLPKRRA